ncbi:MAG: ABC transporter ATP-binding protein [Alphaproteobacteria bacterium]
MPLLEVRELVVDFATRRGLLRAVDGVDFELEEGEVLGIVGESGSGKSVSMLAVMGLLGPTARVRSKRLAFDGHDLLGLSARARRAIVGKDMAMIFQEPTNSLNPCFTIGFQISEMLEAHLGGARAERRRRAAELLAQVGIPDAELRLGAFPHQLSGGMNQRAMIAMAIACNPRLLIADEPTTALDVTIQAQILELLARLQRDRGMAMVLISHDLAVIAETARRVQVMYAGQVVEEQPADRLFEAPVHPYTQALLDSLPERSERRDRLPTIAGVVPGIDDRPTGCLFHPRCRYSQEVCRLESPRPSVEDGGRVRCHTPLDAAGRPRGTPRQQSRGDP